MALFRLGTTAVATPAPGKFWVAPNAIVIGNVHLEEDASVWFNAVIRGDNEAIRIGQRSNVQDGAVLHTDPGFPMTIAADCTIGHMAMLHGCTIGTGSLVGIGSIVLNGAVIGEDCLIGANTLVAEGKQIPARSVVLGSPGRIVREVTDDDRAMLRRAAAHYVRNWRRFAEGLQAQTAG